MLFGCNCNLKSTISIDHHFQIAIPNNSKREAYLSPVGTDYKAMEEDFFL